MASVKKAWIEKYGEKEGLKKWNTHKKKYGRTKEQLIKEHGQNWYDQMIKKKKTFSLEACIKKYGETLGKKKWNERLSKKLNTQKNNFKNKKWKNGLTLQEFQEKYGIEDGYNRWKKLFNKLHYYNSLKRYIKEFGEEEGKKKCREGKDNSSLKAFIRRYGEEDGLARYNENCKKCGITKKRMQAKYGKELGAIKYNEWLLKKSKVMASFGKGYSKISQELFWSVYNLLNDEQKSNTYFAELNEEYQLVTEHVINYPKKIINIDFKCNNIIIEYDGSYWHKNKSLDVLRDSYTKSKGYITLRVNDNDYKKNKEKIINKCKEFINENT